MSNSSLTRTENSPRASAEHLYNFDKYWCHATCMSICHPLTVTVPAVVVFCCAYQALRGAKQFSLINTLVSSCSLGSACGRRGEGWGGGGCDSTTALDTLILYNCSISVCVGVSVCLSVFWYVSLCVCTPAFSLRIHLPLVSSFPLLSSSNAFPCSGKYSNCV